MPELPEVETTAKKLQPIVGKTIARFATDWPRGIKVSEPSFIAKDIIGRRILSISRRGKAVIIALSGGYMLAFHQRMSGRLLVCSKRREEKKHIHAEIAFTDGTMLYFHDPRKFGVIWYGKEDEVMRDAYFARLGADALTVPLGEFKRRLLTKKGMLKPTLLRQDVFAGIGNIVADETLWEARLHPERKITSLSESEIKKLFSALKKVLRRGIRAQGTTLRDWAHPDGARGGFQEYFRVYGRKNLPCPRCGTKIKRIVVGGRGTWICTSCQKTRM